MASDGVSAKVTGSGVSSVTTPDVTTQSSGSLIVYFLHWGTETYSNLTDSKSNTPTQIQTEANASSHKSRLYYKENAAGGANHNATFTVGSAGSPTLYLYEGIGIKTSGSLDTSGVRDDTSSPFTLASALSQAQADSLLFTATGGNSGSNPATHAESGLPSTTIHQELTNGTTQWTGAIGTSIVSSTATRNPSWTETGSSSNHVWLVIFKGINGPTINTQPEWTACADGATATFNYSATTSGGTLTTQAETSADGESWSSASGATNTSFTTPTLDTGDNGRWYRFVYTDDNGSVTSVPVRVWIKDLPITGKGQQFKGWRRHRKNYQHGSRGGLIRPIMNPYYANGTGTNNALEASWQDWFWPDTTIVGVSGSPNPLFVWGGV